MMNQCNANKIFEELSSIGFDLVDSRSNSQKYIVISARSNPRYWFIPMHNRKTALSGLDLFQPLLLSSKIIKYLYIFIIYTRTYKFLKLNYIRFKDSSNFSSYFSITEKLSYAIFSGTDSPHRKITIQIMSNSGSILGYAKFSNNIKVSKLIKHETEILQYVSSLNLTTAIVPNVKYMGNINENTCLITDNGDIKGQRQIFEYSNQHALFLREICEKTNIINMRISDIVKRYKILFKNNSNKLESKWIKRIEKLFSVCDEYRDDLIPCCLSHGDFTPWNTYHIKNKLYVFDWEYADYKAPVSQDLIHYIMLTSGIKNKNIDNVVSIINEKLLLTYPFISVKKHKLLICLYLINNIFLYINRDNNTNTDNITWYNNEIQKQFIDNYL